MNHNHQNDYVELEYDYSFGLKLPKQLNPETLPDTLMVNNPIELQEVVYFVKGNGYRNAYSYRPTMTVNFNTKHLSSPLRGKLHQHDYFELIFNSGSTFEMQIESKLCELKKWDVIILNRSTRHAELFNSDAKLIYLAIAPEYLRSMSSENYTLQHTGKTLFNFFNKGLCDTFQQNKNYISAPYICNHTISPLTHLIDNMKSELEMKQPGYHLIVKGFFTRLLGLLCEENFYDTKYIDLHHDNGFSIALSAKQLIDKSYGCLTMQQLSDTLNYNGSYINRKFKQHYKYSISEYSRLTRIKKSAELLMTTQLSVHEICKQLGFVNRTNFYTLFKQQYSCLPNEYRKKSSRTKREAR